MALETRRYGPEVTNNTSIHCLVLGVGPDLKIPLVREFRRRDPLWKLPGGRNQPGETPLQTALREYEEEVGLRIASENLAEVAVFPEQSHTTHLFVAHLGRYTGLKKQGEENGEASLEIELFRQDAVMQQTLLRRHRRLLDQSRPGLQRLGIDL